MPSTCYETQIGKKQINRRQGTKLQNRLTRDWSTFNRRAKGGEGVESIAQRLQAIRLSNRRINNVSKHQGQPPTALRTRREQERRKRVKKKTSDAREKCAKKTLRGVRRHCSIGVTRAPTVYLRAKSESGQGKLGGS